MAVESKPRSVLFVGGETDFGKASHRTLCLEGFDVTTAEGADAALRVLSQKTIHVALVDLMMPGTNGIELARVIHERYPEIRVLITSAYHLSERQLSRTHCGAVGFLPKPVDPTSLSSLLSEASLSG